MFVRRRPLLGAGMLAGTSYAAHRAGERSVERQYAEAGQDQRLSQLESQPYAAPPPPPPAPPTGGGGPDLVALIEHQRAIPLRDAIQRAGGMPIADAWLAPEDVASIGLTAS
jgi:hypothetical protein